MKIIAKQKGKATKDPLSYLKRGQIAIQIVSFEELLIP